MNISLLLVIAFVLIHFFSKYLFLPKAFLRSFISFSAGVGISYVFVHLWPGVAHSQLVVEARIPGFDSHFLQYALYIVALSGLVIFYALDSLIARAYIRDDIQDPNVLESSIFKADIGFFALYNAMIGYLLTDMKIQGTSLIVFFIAFGLHFITNDWGLRRHHENAYDKYGRWVLSFSILAGYGLGLVTNFPEFLVGSIEAFVTGAMTLNVIKHELPSVEDGNLEGFLAGVISAGLLFLFL